MFFFLFMAAILNAPIKSWCFWTHQQMVSDPNAAVGLSRATKRYPELYLKASLQQKLILERAALSFSNLIFLFFSLQ